MRKIAGEKIQQPFKETFSIQNKYVLRQSFIFFPAALKVLFQCLCNNCLRPSTVLDSYNSCILHV